MNTPDAAVAYANAHRDQALSELCELLTIPSISADPGHATDVRHAAEWMAQWIERESGEAEIIGTAGHPLVWGEFSAGISAKEPAHIPTVLIYGHLDVQPVDPLELWNSDPFNPMSREGRLYARGASDMKAQIIAACAAVRAIRRADVLPVNVKFLLEGEEEIGSPNLPEALQANRERFRADVCLNPDSGMFGENKPTICYGLRGMAYFELRIRGPARDLHSGQFGGVVHNPAQAIAEIVAGLHTSDGRVTLPGFYDRVREITPEERDRLAGMPLTEEALLTQSGVPELWGDESFTTAERIAACPALDVHGIGTGYTGPGAKTVIPSEAVAKLSARLVPDQRPEDVREQLSTYLRESVPPTVTYELIELGTGSAYLCDPSSPAHRAMAGALEDVWGVTPMLSRSGGSVPVAGELRELLGMDSVLTGFGLPNDQIHSPNESQDLANWYRGIEALVRFFYRYADAS